LDCIFFCFLFLFFFFPSSESGCSWCCTPGPSCCCCTREAVPLVSTPAACVGFFFLPDGTINFTVGAVADAASLATRGTPFEGSCPSAATTMAMAASLRDQKRVHPPHASMIASSSTICAAEEAGMYPRYPCNSRGWGGTADCPPADPLTWESIEVSPAPKVDVLTSSRPSSEASISNRNGRRNCNASCRTSTASLVGYLFLRWVMIRFTRDSNCLNSGWLSVAQEGGCARQDGCDRGEPGVRGMRMRTRQPISQRGKGAESSASSAAMD
jgi:hypothetical protein